MSGRVTHEECEELYRVKSTPHWELCSAWSLGERCAYNVLRFGCMEKKVDLPRAVAWSVKWASHSNTNLFFSLLPPLIYPYLFCPRACLMMNSGRAQDGSTLLHRKITA